MLISIGPAHCAAIVRRRPKESLRRHCVASLVQLLQAFSQAATAVDLRPRVKNESENW
jgi:hypothetical protein